MAIQYSINFQFDVETYQNTLAMTSPKITPCFHLRQKKCHLGWIRRTNSGLLRTQQSHGPWKSLAQPSSLPKKMRDDIYFLNDFGDGSFAPNFCKSRYRLGTNVLFVSIYSNDFICLCVHLMSHVTYVVSYRIDTM